MRLNTFIFHACRTTKKSLNYSFNAFCLSNCFVFSKYLTKSVSTYFIYFYNHARKQIITVLFFSSWNNRSENFIRISTTHFHFQFLSYTKFEIFSHLVYMMYFVFVCLYIFNLVFFRNQQLIPFS